MIRSAMPVPLRRDFRARLTTLEDRVVTMASDVMGMVADAVQALREGDLDQVDAVRLRAQQVQEAARDAQEDIVTAFALQAPVASDLRLLTALLHAIRHLSRMAGLCANVARATEQVQGLSADPTLLAELDEMARHTRRVIARAVEAFVRRDLSAVATLPDLDDPVDRLNEGLFRRLVRLATDDAEHLDWAMRMVLVARYLERIGDHGVDLGELTVFAVTGRPA